MNKEVSHYVVTAHPAGSVLVTAKTNFLTPSGKDVLVAKSRRLEVRQLRTPSSVGGGGVGVNVGVTVGAVNAADTSTASTLSPFPIVVSVPINGRITALAPFSVPSISTSLVFVLTDRLRYAVLQYSPQATSVTNPYPITTHAAGSLRGEDQNVLGRQAESGPLVAADLYSRCIALHLYTGLITILPIDHYYNLASASSTHKGSSYRSDSTKSHSHSSKPSSAQVLLPAFHCRIEQATVLAITFLMTDMEALPQLCVLHQGSRGEQHITTMLVNLEQRQLHLYGSPSAPPSTQWIQKSMVDGGSSLLIPVPPRLPTPVVAAAAAASASTSASASVSSGMSRSTEPKKFLTGGVIIVGQQQLTYISPTVTKILPTRQALFLTHDEVSADPLGMPRYLLGDEFGNLHLLTLMIVNDKVVALQRDALGSCTLASSLQYLEQGLVFLGSAWGDSQLVQIHDEPVDEGAGEASASGEDVDLADTSYLSVVEEYTQLGPILDFDLVPTLQGSGQSQVVTASGSSKAGTLRLIRNGIGMNEYAAVEIPGIQNMWTIRQAFDQTDDAFLVQSFVGETRVLGVAAGPDGGTLEEVQLLGLDDAASTLYIGNLPGDCVLQITESQLRLFTLTTGQVLHQWMAEQPITVATANEAGQIAVAMQGGLLVYLRVVQQNKLQKVGEKQMDREVSCLDLHPLVPEDRMEVEDDDDATNRKRKKPTAHASELLAVGLWDDFTVRLLSIDSATLEESLCIHLSTEEDTDDIVETEPSRRNRNTTMARSLCLITLDLSSNNAAAARQGVDMLFVGLGDGTLISFALAKKKGVVSVHSRKEVCLGTQRIDLVPLNTERGGTCVLATGDRPTVIYLAGLGGSASNQSNPKLCYSNVNLATNDEDEGDNNVNRPASQQCIAVNVATPFFSPLLFDTNTFGSQHYSLCVADDATLRLGVIDDIQKLHVTTCRLGMAPRRIVHCPDGRLFAVGCLESGIKHFGLSDDEPNMGNCIRIMDDTTFDDLERIDLEPFEMILSMVYATLQVSSLSTKEQKDGPATLKPFLLVGTAYAIPNEDEPTRGRILVYTCQPDDTTNATPSDSRAIRQVTEFNTTGGVYSMCQFYDGLLLCTVNSKTMICQLAEDTGVMRLEYLGRGHHGNILSLFVKSRAKRTLTTSLTTNLEEGGPGSLAMDVADDNDKRQKQNDDSKPEEKLAIVGDLMRSISLVQYYPEHKTLEEIARDFNSNWTTAIEMLHENVYLGAENWNNLFCLRRNTASTSEEVRCRLETVGEFHLGEMCNKFMSGSLVMPTTNKASSSASTGRSVRSASPSKKRPSDSTPNNSKASGGGGRSRRPVVVTGSQTLFGTVDGTLGVILGLDAKTAMFFNCLERSLAKVIKPIGDFDHRMFRAVEAERRIYPAHGFVDGDLVENFLDLDRSSMEAVVREMNRDGGWEADEDDTSMNPNSSSRTTATTATSEEKADAGGENERADLTVDEVVAMVEEMAMLH